VKLKLRKGMYLVIDLMHQRNKGAAIFRILSLNFFAVVLYISME